MSTKGTARYTCALLISLSMMIANAQARDTLLATPNTNELPSFGDPLSGVISKQQEHDLGRQWLRGLRSGVRTLDNIDAIAWLQDIVYRLFPHAHLYGTQLQFVILDDPALNAFAVPGGIIGINLGLLLYAQDEDELAAVLAHELAHLSQRHFVRQIQQAQQDVPLAWATILASAFVLARQNIEAGIAGIYSSQAALIQNRLRYSRNWEREADRIGFETLSQAGFDPNAMTSMFERMQFSQRFGARPPEFLLTHPMTQARIADSAGRAKNHPAKVRQTSLSFWWFKHHAQLRYRIDNNDQAKQAYLKSALASATKPTPQHAAIALIMASHALAQGDFNTANKRLSGIADTFNAHPLVVHTRARTLLANKRHAQAIKQLRQHLDVYPNHLSLKTLLIDALSDTGQHKHALLEANALSKREPTLINVWQHLERAARKGKKHALAHYARGEQAWLNGQEDSAIEQWQLGLREANKHHDDLLGARIQSRLASMPER